MPPSQQIQMEPWRYTARNIIQKVLVNLAKRFGNFSINYLAARNIFTPWI
jgi:hypothetical protein